MPLKVRRPMAMSEANIAHRYHAIHAWPRDFSPTGLRVLREVAQSGSFSAAARVAGLHAVGRLPAGRRRSRRSPDGALFERRRDGVVADAGRRAAARPGGPRARRARRGHRATRPSRTRRPGRCASGRSPPRRRGSCPGRWRRCRATSSSPCARRRRPPSRAALRAGTLDLAVLAQTPPFRPPDAEAPALDLTTLAERELVIGVGARHPFAGRRAVEVGELAGQVWVGQPLGGRRVAARRLAGPRRAARRALRRARLVGQAAARRRRPGDHDARPRGARRAPRRRAGRRRARRAAGAAAPGPRPPCPARSTAERPRSPTRWSSAAGPEPSRAAVSRARAGAPPGAPARPGASSHAPPTDVIHEIASPRGAGVGR